MFKRMFRSRQNVMLENLEKRLSHLEQSIHKVTEHGFKNHIHIETLHVHNPALEKLEFRFDELDIEEVSGALNVGNNFGVRVHPRVTRRRATKDASSVNSQSQSSDSVDEEHQNDGPTIRKTTGGFTFRFPST